MFFDLLPGTLKVSYRYIFHVKFIFLCLNCLIRIRIRISLDPHWFVFLDSDPYLDPH
jgi:hypothetical protein